MTGVAVFLAMSWVSQASAATLVVDASGGGDALTIEEGLALAADGDTIEVRAGVYVEGDLVNPVDNLTIVGDGPLDTVIDMSSWSNAYAFQFEGNWTVRDMGFVAPASGGQAIYYFNRFGQDTDVGVIENCRFEGFGMTLVPTAPFGGLYVLDSVFLEPGYPIVTGFVGSSGPVHFENNVVVDANAILLEEDYAGDTGEFVFRGNTFIRGACAVARPGYHSDATLEFVGNVSVGGVCGVSVDGDRGDTVAYNIGVDLDRPFVSDENIEDAHSNLEADPEFCAFSSELDLHDYDLRLQASSPAIDLLPEELSASGNDNEGGLRPLDGDGDGSALSDAGAFEFDPTRVCEALVLEDTGIEDSAAGDSPATDSIDSALHESAAGAAESLADSPTDSLDLDLSPPAKEPEPTCGCAGGAGLVLPGLLLLLLGRRRV